MNNAGNQTSLRILALGALLGIGIALAVVLGNVSANSWTNSNQPLSASVIAKVNSTEVRLLEYQRALKMLADDRRDAITDLDRELVLQRLIDEELLSTHRYGRAHCSPAINSGRHNDRDRSQ